MHMRHMQRCGAAAFPCSACGAAAAATAGKGDPGWPNLGPMRRSDKRKHWQRQEHVRFTKQVARLCCAASRLAAIAGCASREAGFNPNWATVDAHLRAQQGPVGWHPVAVAPAAVRLIPALLSHCWDCCCLFHPPSGGTHIIDWPQGPAQGTTGGKGRQRVSTAYLMLLTASKDAVGRTMYVGCCDTCLMVVVMAARYLAAC